MIKTFLNKNLLLGNKIQSVQIHLQADQKEYHLLEIRKSKSNLEIIDRYTTSDVEDLLTKVSDNKPLIISIIGQGVLSKKVDNETNYQSKILFNADPDDFYWYEFKQEKDVYVSVARKELIDKEVAVFENAKISVFDFSIGSFGLTAVKPLIESTELYSKTSKLVYQEEELTSFTKNTDKTIVEYTIGDEQISSQEILCFSNVLQFFYPNDTIESDTHSLAENREEFVYKKAFNIVGACTLGFFLLSLLISYMLLGHYQNAHHKLQVELGEQNVAYSKLVSLEKDKENKEAILKQSGLSDSNYLSFYISEITKEMPSEVNLKLLNIFPTASKIKAAQKIEFMNNLIQIEGTVVSNTAFASWIKKLKECTWINNVEIIDFQRENRTNSFVIKLIVKFDV